MIRGQNVGVALATATPAIRHSPPMADVVRIVVADVVRIVYGGAVFNVQLSALFSSPRGVSIASYPC